MNQLKPVSWLDNSHILFWGGYTTIEPYTIYCVFYDEIDSLVLLQFFNKGRYLELRGELSGRCFNGTIDKQSLILQNTQYDVRFMDFLNSITAIQIDTYAYSSESELPLPLLLFEEPRIIMNEYSSDLDSNIQSIIDLSYVQDVFQEVHRLIWTSLPRTLTEIKYWLQVDNDAESVKWERVKKKYKRLSTTIMEVDKYVQ